MSIPDYQSLMLPVLHQLSDRREHAVADVRQRIAAELNLSDEELAERLASDTTTVFMNRVGWAVQYLKSAGVIRSVRRGVYEITDRGLAMFRSNPSDVTLKVSVRPTAFLRSMPDTVDLLG